VKESREREIRGRKARDRVIIRKKKEKSDEKTASERDINRQRKV
jgi:hypothetical protein